MKIVFWYIYVTVLRQKTTKMLNKIFVFRKQNDSHIQGNRWQSLVSSGHGRGR